MAKIRRATVSDLPTLAHIHKKAYSRNHFTALLPDDVLMRYYSYFFAEGSEIWLAVDDSFRYEGAGIPVEGILGFSVFGSGMPEKISKFKRECRLDILCASLRYPWMASKKVFNTLKAKLKTKDSYIPADFLLLSVAVAYPQRGIGRILLTAMFETLNEHECRSVGLYVNADNFGAINAYFSLGFIIMNFQHGQFYMERKLK